MTKKERKEIAVNVVGTYMGAFISPIYADPEKMYGNKRFIEGMITGYEYTGLITTDERIEWLKEIYKEFDEMNKEFNEMNEQA